MSHKRSSPWESWLEILEYIARHGEISKWQLAKELEKPYSVIYKNIKKMVMYHLVEVTKVEPSQKNPKIKVEFYNLTVGGLIDFLNYERPWRYIEEIIQTHSKKLPLIFGKWKFFKRKKLSEIIIDRLLWGVLSYRTQLPKTFFAYNVVGDHDDFEKRAIKHYGKEEGRRVGSLKRNIVGSSLTDKVLGLDLKLLPKEFLETVIEDADLKRYYDQRFEEWEKHYKKEYKQFLELTNWYQKIRSQL